MATNLAHAKLASITKYNDVFIAIAAMIVVGMMIIPLPEWAMDVMLTLNITMALTIFLVTIYSHSPLEFSSFPAMLLISTLFRLALNIAATRLILLNGSAGAVISAFGSVVLGGNYVVGIVIFIILIIIQFVVITSGTGRVAEVAARFTLDAMPGKQMAIDADLNAGIIDETQAQQRRRDVARESDFYGAMDGSSKFVRGDAIAAVIMIIINIIGGFLIGITQRHMDLMTAVQTYTLLTVGMGLITQIPALIISTATGLMVTKAATENNLGSDMAAQMLAQPKAVMIAAILCGAMALMPGIPKVPFLLIACGGIYLARVLERQQTTKKTEAPKPEPAVAAPESMADLLSIDPISLELGYGLIPLADPKQGGDLLDRITAVRRQTAVELGLLVPAIRVRDNMQLKPNAYVIKLRGVEIARGELYTGHMLAMDPGSASGKISGIETKEPAFGLSAIWVSDVQQTEAELMGYTVVDPLTVLITHLTEVLRSHAAEILTRQDTQVLIDNTKAQAPAVVNELIPELLSLGDVQRVLQNLLSERISIKDMPLILEALADGARLTRDPDILTEYVRQAMCRQITAEIQSTDGIVRAFTLDPLCEQVIAEHIRTTEMSAQLVLDPDVAKMILNATRTQIEKMNELGYPPVALCSPKVRPHYRRLIERMAPTLMVISYNELAPGVNLETLGMVSLANENG